MGSWLAPIGSFAALSDSELTTTNRAMMRIDSLSTSVGKSFAWLILVLTVAMTYKVFVRYALNAPITWAFDFSDITCGALFLMAGASTLSRNAHVRGDFLYRSWWPRTQASRRDPKPVAEGRKVLARPGWCRRVVLIDSTSLIDPADAGQMIVTGTHGALVGSRPEMALQADGYAAAFNDAGVGRDGASISRLAALDQRGIAGLAVSAASARIGDAASAYEDGIVSFTNKSAGRLGARAGEALKSRLATWLRQA